MVVTRYFRYRPKLLILIAKAPESFYRHWSHRYQFHKARNSIPDIPFLEQSCRGPVKVRPRDICPWFFFLKCGNLPKHRFHLLKSGWALIVAFLPVLRYRRQKEVVSVSMRLFIYDLQFGSKGNEFISEQTRTFGPHLFGIFRIIPIQ